MCGPKTIKYLGHGVSGLAVLLDLGTVKVLDKWDIQPLAYSTKNEEISVQEHKTIRKEIVHSCRLFPVVDIHAGLSICVGSTLR